MLTSYCPCIWKNLLYGYLIQLCATKAFGKKITVPLPRHSLFSLEVALDCLSQTSQFYPTTSQVLGVELFDKTISTILIFYSVIRVLSIYCVSNTVLVPSKPQSSVSKSTFIIFILYLPRKYGTILPFQLHDIFSTFLTARSHPRTKVSFSQKSKDTPSSSLVVLTQWPAYLAWISISGVGPLNFLDSCL